jgi:hypothetical protein
VTPSDIKKILSYLRKNNVQRFKSGDVEISFFQQEPKVKPDLSSKPLSEELKAIAQREQGNIPPDLRADDTMNFDKILHWSGSPDQEELPMPLTGEGEL